MGDNTGYEIEYHKLYIVLKNITPQDRLTLPRMLKKLEVIKNSGGNFKNKHKKAFLSTAAPPTCFYSKTTNNDEVRVHINNSKVLLFWLLSLGYSKDDIKLISKDPHIPDNVKVGIRKEFSPRDYQVPYLDWILDTPYPNLLEPKPGDGKTFMGLYSTHKLGYRTVIVVKAQWVNKWKNDIKTITTTKDEDILTVAGSSSLKAAFELYSSGGGNHKYIVISNRTMQNFITSYERTVDVDTMWTYPIYPEEYMSTFRAGILLIDEIHLDFNFNFKLLLYTDAVKMIGMSGTYGSDNTSMRHIEDTMFPPDQRMKARERKKFTYITSVSYSYSYYIKVPTTAYSTSNGYNHIKYESFILNRIPVLLDYTGMILKYIESKFIDNRVKGDKCMVYAASIPMCTYLQMIVQYYFKDLKVRRYVEDDSYDNVLEADITISTILSSGTAFDIPNLTTVIQTVAISSSQSNLQNTGRLRALKDKKVRFVYFYTPIISKHVTYHNKRKAILAEEAIEYINDAHDTPMGNTNGKLRRGEYREDIVETIFGPYALNKYIAKSYPGVINKLVKEINNVNTAVSTNIVWKKRSVTNKRTRLASAEKEIPILQKLIDKLK